MKCPGCLSWGVAYPQRGECLAQRLLFQCSMHSRMRIKDIKNGICNFISGFSALLHMCKHIHMDQHLKTPFCIFHFQVLFPTCLAWLKEAPSDLATPCIFCPLHVEDVKREIYLDFTHYSQIGSKGSTQKKNTRIFGNFSQVVDYLSEFLNLSAKNK